MAEVKGPVVIEVGGSVDPAAAPLPPDLPTGGAMVALAGLAARPRSRLGAWFWRLLAALLGLGVSLWAWDFVTGLFARSSLLGWLAFVLVIGLALVSLVIGLRELSGFVRLRRLDRIHAQATRALNLASVSEAREVGDQMLSLYEHRPELAQGRAYLSLRLDESVDGEALLAEAETALLTSLDRDAVLAIEAAARQVATVTAVVPLMFADVAAALIGNVRMIRRIAEIYGGRAGTFGSLRLVRIVLTHLVATGAVAVGDDLIGSLAGGGLLSKLSRRFGEGVINGALTARVGVAAMEVCRPLPFVRAKRPSVSALVARALKGLFG
jgi:putative membrane protein